ncbi:hypothetical protein L4D09_11615 [Photobacterium makurazakiensis]|uniref:hypothetical protein n=1 Tax=Photobacterium makurazakiensis TaxID=2910234 RepID=UPI003D1383DE
MMNRSWIGGLVAVTFCLGLLVSYTQNYAENTYDITDQQQQFLAVQHDYLSQLYKAKGSLIEFGEENSPLYLTIENAIKINEELLDDAEYWRDHYISMVIDNE